MNEQALIETSSLPSVQVVSSCDPLPWRIRCAWHHPHAGQNLNPEPWCPQVVSSRDPLQLPWKEMDIDLVIEGTGVFVDSKGAGKHIEVRS